MSNQAEYCKFIEKYYKSKSFLANIKETEQFLRKIERKNKKENYRYIMTNLRMSICELG
jgi:hypothetical protein